MSAAAHTSPKVSSLVGLGAVSPEDMGLGQLEEHYFKAAMISETVSKLRLAPDHAMAMASKRDLGGQQRHHET